MGYHEKSQTAEEARSEYESSTPRRAILTRTNPYARESCWGNQTASARQPEFDQKISTDEYPSRIAPARVTQVSLVRILRGGHRDHRTRVLESQSRTKKTCYEG